MIKLENIKRLYEKGGKYYLRYMGKYFEIVAAFKSSDVSGANAYMAEKAGEVGLIYIDEALEIAYLANMSDYGVKEL